MSNTLKTSYERGGAALDVGSYIATLSGVKEVQAQNYQAEGTHTALEFTYEIETGDEIVTYRKTCRASINSKSNLYKDLSVMDSRFYEVCESDELLNQFIQTLVGHKFLVNIVPTETGKVKIGQVTKVPKSMQKTATVNGKPATEAEKRAADFEADDIPF